MNFEHEKDYIMRIIRDLVRVLFSLLFWKKLTELKEMIAQRNINQAENILLAEMDYTTKNDITAATLFYQYLGEKRTSFQDRIT